MVGMIQSPDINSSNFWVEMSHLHVQVDTDWLVQLQLFAKMMEHIMQVLLLVRQLQVTIILFIDNKLSSKKTQMSEIYWLWIHNHNSDNLKYGTSTSEKVETCSILSALLNNAMKIEKPYLLASPNYIWNLSTLAPNGLPKRSKFSLIPTVNFISY